MIRRTFSLFLLLYLAVGVYIAWTHHYLTLGLVKNVASALLAIFLWVLVPLGVNLHVR